MSTMAVKPNPLVPFLFLLFLVVVVTKLSVATTTHVFVVHHARSPSRWSPYYYSAAPPTFISRQNMSVDKPEIVVVSKPDEDFLAKKGVFNWGKWGCPASKFPWTYGSTESCYLLKGKVTVTPSDECKAVKIAKGDFATFPAGMSCTWDVEEAVEKHYMFF